MTTIFDDPPQDIPPEHLTPMTPELRAMFDKLPLPTEEEFLLWKEEMRAIHKRNGH